MPHISRAYAGTLARALDTLAVPELEPLRTDLRLASPTATSPRVLLYSHDSFGLGHIRRTLSICDTLRTEYERASVLVLTGSSSISNLPIPAGVDWIKLPGVTKVDNGHYRSRHLPLAFEAVRCVRREIIRSTADAYKPTLVFVDNVPLGLEGEMRSTLEALRTSPDVRIVLTLRDVIDEPRRVIADWARQGLADTIDRLYDDIVVFGSPEIFDPVVEYRWPRALAAKCHYAGYIERQPQGSVTDTRHRLLQGAEQLVLVTVGGGGDGAPLVERYLAGLTSPATDGLGARVRSLVVCGPEMDPSMRTSLRNAYGSRPDMTIVDFLPDMVTTMAAADVVVSMGGYNTVCEILSLRKRAVVMPRRHPRLEQWIRCTRMADRGLLRVVDPTGDIERDLIAEVRAALSAPPPPVSTLDLGGLAALERLLPHLTGNPSA